MCPTEPLSVSEQFHSALCTDFQLSEGAGPAYSQGVEKLPDRSTSASQNLPSPAHTLTFIWTHLFMLPGERRLLFSKLESYASICLGHSSSELQALLRFSFSPADSFETC